MHAQGEPTTLEELNAHPPLTGDNAADHYRRAIAALDALSATARDYLSTVCHDPRSADELGPGVRRIFAENPEILREARAACDANYTDWGLQYTQLAVGTRTPHVMPQWELGGALCAAAIADGCAGDTAGFASDMRCILRAGDALEANRTGVPGHLMHTVLDGLAGTAVEGVWPRLHLSARQPDTPPVADRSAIESLVRDLLDEQAYRSALRDSLRGERLIFLDFAHVLEQATRFSRVGLMAHGGSISAASCGEWIVVPAFMLSADRAARRFRAATLVDTSGGFEEGREALRASQIPPPRGRIANMQNRTWFFAWRTYDYVLELDYRARATRRMAACALALKLYEADHGALPPTLGELVPDYLPAVPLDPFDPARQPIRYLPQASPPRLYSLSGDGTDDSGQFARKADGVIDPDKLDLVFLLGGERSIGPRKFQLQHSGVQPAAPPLRAARTADEPNLPTDAGHHER
jgi:hypothetical protein